MARLTPEQIDTCTKPHGVAEFARDLEATMATVGPGPLLWEYHPLGLALVDREAVQAQYQIVFDNVLPYIVSHTERSRAYGDNFVMQEQMFRYNFDGNEFESPFTVVVVCDDEGRYVTSERCYASGAFAAMLERIFDDSFRALPGVVDLSAPS